MSTYYLKRDVLNTVWFREWYKVRASSKKEAYEKFIQANKDCTEDPTLSLENEDIEFSDGEPLDETYEEVIPDGHNPTVTIDDEEDNGLWNNVDGKL